MPEWKGKEYPYTAKGIAAYWAARGKDEKIPYKRKKVKAKSAQAKPKPSSVEKERVFRDKPAGARAAIDDLSKAGLSTGDLVTDEYIPDIDQPKESYDKHFREKYPEVPERRYRTDPTPVKADAPQPPPPKKSVGQLAKDVRYAFAEGAQDIGKKLKKMATPTTKRVGKGKTNWDKKKKGRPPRSSAVTADLKEEMASVQRKRKKKY